MSMMDVAKSSYVLRRSNILNRWKRCYLALYVDGTIRYFESENSHSAEETKHIAKCTHIVFNLTEYRAPNQHNTDCLFKLTFKNREEWIFAAASKEDCEIWIMALKESLNDLSNRNIPAGTEEIRIAGLRQGIQPIEYLSQPMYGQQFVSNQQYQPIYDQYGNIIPPTQVIYVDNNNRYNGRRRRNDNTMMNVAAGAMIGTMVMSPLLFW